MDKLTSIIRLIKEIDKDLDAYDFSGIPYEEYLEYKKLGKKGPYGLRNTILYNSGGLRVWSSWMEECIDNCKTLCNELYMKNKHNTPMTFDSYKIRLLLNRLDDVKRVFKQNTDKYSLYPIQSENICKNLELIRKTISEI